MVIKIESDIVSEIPDLVAPSEGKFPSFGVHVGYVLKRSRCTDGGRKFHSCAEHADS